MFVNLQLQSTLFPQKKGTSWSLVEFETIEMLSIELIDVTKASF